MTRRAAREGGAPDRGRQIGRLEEIDSPKKQTLTPTEIGFRSLPGAPDLRTLGVFIGVRVSFWEAGGDGEDRETGRLFADFARGGKY